MKEQMLPDWAKLSDAEKLNLMSRLYKFNESERTKQGCVWPPVAVNFETWKESMIGENYGTKD